MCLEAEIARAEIVAGLVGLASAPDHCPVLTLQYIGTAVRMGLESLKKKMPVLRGDVLRR